MKKVLIVNPFVSQKYLMDQLDGRVQLTALFTCDISSLDSYSVEDVAVFKSALWIKEDEILSRIPELKSYNFDYILNGSEESTIIFDHLSNALMPKFGNDIKTSYCRFDKLEMQDAMRRANLPYISTEQVKVSEMLNSPSLLEKLNYPVFFKPKQGYGSVGAFKANDKGDAIANLMNIDSSKDDYIVQTFVEGDEYVVDTFSLEGKHYIASIQRYKKEMIGGNPVYRYCEIVPEKDVWTRLEEFSEKMLDALSVRNGFAHSEIMYSPESGIKLIELNNRISGCKGAINACAQQVGFKSQTDLLCDFLEGKDMASSNFEGQHYGAIATIFKMGGGIVKPIDTSNLSTVRSIFWCKKTGSMIPENQEYNLLDAVAYLICVGTYDEVHRDMAAIFSREKDGVLV